MSIKFNPLIFSGFDLTGGAGIVYWQNPVATENDLPVPGSQDGEARVVQDTDKIYIWDATTSKWIDTGITLASFGGTSPEGLTTSTSTSGDFTRRTLQLNEASSTTPGAVSTGTQNFAGEKTFDDLTTASSGIETDSIDSITGGAGTLSIGTSNASTINIGDAGVDVNLYGNTFYQEVTNLEVTDKQVTLNKNGAAGSAFNSGIELEENGSITGYVSTSGDRASWELKPPGVVGTATISPGAAGITIDQSSHDPVTLGAVGSSPNTDGASLTNQVLNLEPADATNPGVVTAGTQTIGGAKTLVDELTASGGIYYDPSAPTDWTSPVPAQIAPALDQLASRFTNQNNVTNEPTGFPDRIHSEILFSDNAGNPIFTIQPKAPYTSFDVYIKGNKFTKTSSETVTSLSHPSFPYTGNNYFYYDQNGVLQVTNVFSPLIIQEYAFISIVYWNPETNTHSYFAEERHGLTMDGTTHSYLHTVFGARFLSGLALQNFTIGNGSSNADAQFNVDQGQIRDEDILISIAAEAQIPILYRKNLLWRKKPADAYPFIHNGNPSIYGGTRVPYNLYIGGIWDLYEVQNNKYVLMHFFATNDKENGVIGIQGIAQYDSIEAARIAANTEITSLGGLPFAEFVPIGTVVLQTSSSMVNDPKADVIPINGGNYIDFRGTQLYTPAGEATTHGLLSGLANDDHQQYLLVDGTRAMTGDLDMGMLYQVKNVADGTDPNDAINLSQITKTPTTFAGFDDAGLLNPVPGWTFDDTGATQVGAQNSLVIPSGVVDFITISVSSGISNPGLNTYSGVQFNPSIDTPVNTFAMVQTYGYGSSAPVNYTSFQSQPGFSGTSTNLTHFSASGSVNATGIIGYNYFHSGNSTNEVAFQASSSGTTSNYTGVNISPFGSSTNFIGFNSTPVGNTSNYTGINIAPQNSGTSYTGVKIDGASTYTDATGMDIDLSNITTSNRKVGITINDGSLQQVSSFSTTSNLPSLVDSGNLLRPVFTVSSPITGTDVSMSHFAGFMQFNDDYSGSAFLDLGVSSVAAVSQVAGSSGANVDKISMLTTGLAVDSTSTGGTIADAHLVRCVALTLGGTLTIDNLYGLRIDDTVSSVASNTWGISVEDPNAENYLAKSLVVGGVSKKVVDQDTAIEIQDPKMLIVGNTTTAEKNAFASHGGAIVFDSDENKLYYNDTTKWVRVGLPPGDIDQTTFTALDNQTSPADVTGFVFSNTITRAFQAIVGISRGSTYAEYSIKGVQKASSWELSQDYVGDDTGITFSITSAGQVQYTSTSTGNKAGVSFRADTVPVVSVTNGGGTYESTVLADSPYIYYKFQETSGTTIQDSSGNNRNATLTLGSGALNQSGIAGGKSILFDGTSTLVVSDNVHATGSPVSVEFWFKTSSTSPAAFVSHSGPGGWSPEVLMSNDALSKITSYVFANSAQTLSTPTGGYADNQWHHVVTTVGSNNNHTIYVDGVPVITGGNNNAYAFSAYWKVGMGSNVVMFQGNITEVAIYNTELSAARVLAHYNAGIAP